MFSALQRLSRQLMSLTLAACLGLCLMLTACSGAGASTLTGDYVEDTVAVVHTLQSTIAMGQDDEGRAEAETAATDLINDYMSRYRPRPQVNGLSSFTTMQTALNSLAGHYKTYANRPLPDTLRARVDKELGKAEKAAVRGS
ncbi:photosystem II protein Psb27 [Synechococcus sp. RS9916]|uniref:photosystem II protein Psb27 n=1 Tax=Synechococcus sp. RS9916 TaxID=221359 RepID=UPI0000E53E5F|nr:photosystem II protein Psb27 [Synechococcus sp. RS9916]EAU73249.1 possible photosystem II Psb27 protein [Synechococcus sp. RS9916]